MLLTTAGDNIDRLRSEGCFAAVCGSSPVDASSGKQQRHRLNRGGDRQANSALYLIVLNRLSWDPRTKAYMQRRLAEGKTKKEVIRCLKRYVARRCTASSPKTSAISRALTANDLNSPLDSYRSIHSDHI